MSSFELPDQQVYEEKPVIRNASSAALQAAGVGVVATSIEHALGSHSSGAWGFLTRSARTIGFFVAMGATFAFTDSVAANVRRKDDALNGVAGGCAAGFLAGIRARSLPMAVGSCALLGGAIGLYDYSGQLTGSEESKEERRKKFFKQPPPTSSPVKTYPAESRGIDINGVDHDAAK